MWVEDGSGSRVPAQVLEEPHPAGQLPEQPDLLGGHPGGEEVRYPSRIVQEGDDTVAGFGQRPDGDQNALQHRVEVEAFVDAQAGLAQPEQPVSQLRYLSRSRSSDWSIFPP